MLAGKNAGLYALGKLNRTKEHMILAGDGIRYTVPSSYFENDDQVEVFFRVTKKIRNAEIVVIQDNVETQKQFSIALTPGEMSSIKVNKKGLNQDITISVREKK